MRVLRLTVGSLFTRNDFSLAKGREEKTPLCFIHFVVCLARFTFAKYLSCKISADVFFLTQLLPKKVGERSVCSVVGVLSSLRNG